MDLSLSRVVSVFLLSDEHRANSLTFHTHTHKQFQFPAFKFGFQLLIHSPAQISFGPPISLHGPRPVSFFVFLLLDEHRAMMYNSLTIDTHAHTRPRFR
jgi:hypothetical protein